jgi:RNA polymerase subunit RPABC4/transcription elongation factor Spt4
MHCRNCGKEVVEKAEICPSCGVRPLAEKNHCQECGVETKSNQEICVKCGVRLRTMQFVTEMGSPINTNFNGLPPYYQKEFKQIMESNGSYTGKWNWAAFFFGAFWGISKGLWLSAIVHFAVVLITVGVGGIIYNIIYGFRGNNIYYNKIAKNKQAIF